MRLIDADALINDRENFIVIGAGDNICIDISDIAKAPTIEAEPVKHGRWEFEVGMNFYKERNCPVCKKRIESNFWSYCPNCGAKMDGGTD